MVGGIWDIRAVHIGAHAIRVALVKTRPPAVIYSDGKHHFNVITDESEWYLRATRVIWTRTNMCGIHSTLSHTIGATEDITLRSSELKE